LKGNPANIQDFLTFSAKKEPIAQKSCIIAGIFKNSNKIGKNDVFMHHFFIVKKKRLISMGMSQI